MNIVRKCLTLTAPKLIRHTRPCSSLYEPDYLEGMKPKVPLYDTLNIQLRSYDFPVLESYQKYLHNLFKNLDINVEDTWACPAQELQICTYKPKSEIVNTQYKLLMYSRSVQITDVTSTQLPVLYRIIDASLPVGVTAQVVNHEEYHEEERYIPDSELNKLKDELELMGGPSKKR